MPRFLLACCTAAALLVAGCDRAAVDGADPAPAGPEGTFRSTLDRPNARFLSPGLPDRACRRSSLTLAFRPPTFALTCDVSDGIVVVQYTDDAALRVQLEGDRVEAESKTGFLFSGTLAADTSRITGVLSSPSGESIELNLPKR